MTTECGNTFGIFFYSLYLFKFIGSMSNNVGDNLNQ